MQDPLLEHWSITKGHSITLTAPDLKGTTCTNIKSGPSPGQERWNCCAACPQGFTPCRNQHTLTNDNPTKAVTLHQAGICSLLDNSSQRMWQPQGLSSTQHQIPSSLLTYLWSAPNYQKCKIGHPPKKSVLLWSGFVFTCSAIRQRNGAGGELLCPSISCFTFWTNHWNWLLSCHSGD